MRRRGAGVPVTRPDGRGVPVHPAGPATSGRHLAFLVLQQHDFSGRFIADLLAECDPAHELPPRERSAAVDIASEVIRRRRTIDLLLRLQVRRRRTDTEPDVWRLLQIGAVQLLSQRTPRHAAVDSTVELTRTLGRHRWSGFVNGVLRGFGQAADGILCR